MPGPRDPVEKVRILTAVRDRGQMMLQKDLAADLGLTPDVLSTFLNDHGAGGDIEAALASAIEELNDLDRRAAAAGSAKHRSKTQEHARKLFNAEQGEALSWGAFGRLLTRAADRGLDGSTPAPPPPGQVIKGLSTMHVRDPETGEMTPSVVWTKTKQDAPDAADAIRRAGDALRLVPRLPPVALPARPRARELLNLVAVTDVHFGQESDPLETGATWNVPEAERVIVGCAELLLRAAPPADVLLLAFLGDYLDSEGPAPQTFESRHPLPSRTAFPGMVEAATRVARRLIDRGLETHARVKVAAVDGNHDPASAVWLRELLRVAYEREPRVEVLYGAPRYAPHCAYQHGEVMLGFAHQHLTKSAELPQMFRDDYREMFGVTRHAEIHCGHLHHYKVETHGAVKVYQHPTLAARSRHVARHGWHGDRSMRLATFHDHGGRRWEAMVRPEMLG